MPCYMPLEGYMSEEVNPSGKRSWTRRKDEAFTPQKVLIPCGKCIGCRKARARDWTIRICNEASLYDENCFITLTFNEENEQKNFSLEKEDFSLFMKRLRKRCADGFTYVDSQGKEQFYQKTENIRFFHCGEYGEKFERPHHHACIFNFDFPDKVVKSRAKGYPVYSSALLEELWPYGFSDIGTLTPESASYVARYVNKKLYKNKIYPKHVENYYSGRLPEFCTMSLRPGIGKLFIDQFKTEVLLNEFLVLNGFKFGIPKYYIEKLSLTDPDIVIKIKSDREIRAINDPDNSPERREVKEELQIIRAKQLERSFENGAENICGKR